MSYSWHPDVRGPQVYRVYAASEAAQLKSVPRGVSDLSNAGWPRLAEVDTRPDGKPMGGQYGVSIRDASGDALGRFRYVLLDISATEADRLMSHTFFSEIVIVDGKEHPMPKVTKHVETLHIGNNYEILFDTTEMPEIRPWVDARLKPVCAQWYPKIVELLPSEDFTAPQQFRIVFHKDMRGVANTSGTQSNCAGP